MVHKVLFWGGFGISSPPSTCLTRGWELIQSYCRPRSPRMATRSRNATFLQQGIAVGIPSIRRRGSELRVLDSGCRSETTEDFGSEESKFVGEEGAES